MPPRAQPVCQRPAPRRASAPAGGPRAWRAALAVAIALATASGYSSAAPATPPATPAAPPASPPLPTPDEPAPPRARPSGPRLPPAARERAIDRLREQSQRSSDDAQRPRPPVQDTPLNREAARGFLTRWAESLSAASERLASAVRRLDAGEPIADVRQVLDTELRSLRAGLRWPERDLERFFGGLDRSRATPAPGEPRSLPGAGTPPRLSPAERTKLRALLQEHRPELLARLEALAAGSEQERDRVIDALAPRLRGLAELQQDDPEMFEIRVQEGNSFLDLIESTRALAKARSGADQGATDRAREAVRRALTAQLDLRLSAQELSIRRVRERLDREQGELDRTRANREQILDTQLRQAERRGIDSAPPSPRRGPQNRANTERPPAPRAAPAGDAPRDPPPPPSPPRAAPPNSPAPPGAPLR